MITNKKQNDLFMRLTSEHHLIPANRRVMLEGLAKKITEMLMSNGHCDIIAICTHNSRRSQLAELWLSIGAKHFNLDNVRAWSGGTEATAFNYRVIYALQYRGLEIFRAEDGNNPHYRIRDLPEHVFFSKKYDDNYNPKDGFLALTVCDHADQNCPLVFGASQRVFIPYIDPKIADDTDEEIDTYVQKVDEIGREMLYCLTRVAKEHDKN